MIDALAPFPKYKRSGLPWVPEVPEHWKLVPNRAVIRRRKVLVGERHTEYQLLSLTKRGVIVRDLEGGKGKFSSDMGTSQEVRAGDLIFCLFDVPETPRTVGLSRHSGMITGAYTVFDCSDALLAAFLELFYRAMDDRKLLSPLYSGLRNTIPPVRFLGTKTPIPPPEEQAAIVRFLDYVDRKTRRYIRAKRQLITLLEEQKQAIIHRAVTRGLDPNIRLKQSGVDWLGEVPEHWDEIRLKFLVRKITDGEHISPPLANEGIPLLSAKDIRDRTILYEVDKHVTPEHAEQFWRRCRPEIGDFLVVSRGATIGRVALVVNKTPFCLMGSVILCKSRGDYAAEFLYYALNAYHAQTSLWFTSASSAQQAIYIRDVAELRLPIPPSSEREDIVLNLEESLAGIKNAEYSSHREIELINEYRTRLIADVVTGKLDVREASARLPEERDEPVAEDDLSPDGDDIAEDEELDLEPEEVEA